MILYEPLVFVHLGDLPIATHGLMFGIALMVCMMVARRQLRKRGDLSPREEIFENVLFWSALAGFVGSRVAYVLLNLDYFWRDPVGMFRIWEGGMVSFGGLIGGVGTASLMLWWKKEPVKTWLDFATPLLFLGWAIGRIGNFIPWETIGTPTSLPWGIVVGGDVARHPVQLYSSIVNFFMFLLFLKFSHRRRTPGAVFALGVVCYGILRFLLELLRDYPNSEYHFFYRHFAQGMSIVLIFTGIFLFKKFSRKKK